MTEENLCMLEHGQVPNLGTIAKLADYLGIAPSVLGCFDSMPDTNFMERLRKARFYRGMNKEQAAKTVGVNVKTWRSWETGLHKPLKRYINAVEDFCSVLDENHE